MSAPPEWISANWPAPPGIVAGCTTRVGGVSGGCYGSLNLGEHVGDSHVSVQENRRRFVTARGLPAAPKWLNQVHGDQVAIDPPGDAQVTADGILCRESGSVCAVMIADCLPILFVSADGREVAAAHAGWRGLCGGVVEATVQAFAAAADQIIAWLGPAISQRHFEVGREVRAAFIASDKAAVQHFVQNDAGRYQADLCGLARQRLAAAGVHRVYGGDFCTYAESELFFSYRRDGQCGRMASFVFRAT